MVTDVSTTHATVTDGYTLCAGGCLMVTDVSTTLMQLLLMVTHCVLEVVSW